MEEAWLKNRLQQQEHENRVINIDDHEEELDNLAFPCLKRLIGSVDNVRKSVSHVREQIRDGEALLGVTSSLFSSIAEKKYSINGVSPSQFVSTVRRDFACDNSLIGDEEVNCEANVRSRVPEIDWIALGERATHIFSDVFCGCCTLLGSFELKNSGRVRNFSRTRGTVSELQQSSPLMLLGNDAKDDQATDMKIQDLYRSLLTEKSLILDSLLMEVSAFSEAVEILFVLSFLVKDGHAEIIITENGEHLIVPKNVPTPEDLSRGLCHTQFVFRIDYKEWEVMQEKHKKRKEIADQGTDPLQLPLFPKQQLRIVENDLSTTRIKAQGKAHVAAILQNENDIEYLGEQIKRIKLCY